MRSLSTKEVTLSRLQPKVEEYVAFWLFSFHPFFFWLQACDTLYASIIGDCTIIAQLKFVTLKKKMKTASVKHQKGSSLTWITEEKELKLEFFSI